MSDQIQILSPGSRSTTKNGTKNVLFFTHHLWAGGAEKTVCTLSEYINLHVPGITSYICVVYDDPEMHQKLHNVIVMEHRSQKDDSRAHKALNVLRQIREMRQIKRRYHIDTCVSFLPGADIINVLSGTGERQIVSVRSRESQFTKNIFKKVYVETAYRRCDLITTVSDVVRQDVISFFGVNPEKVRTIHNAVIMQPLTGNCQDAFLDFVKDRHVFITVGRLRRVKGQIHLLYAFRDYLASDPEAGLVIAGGGELYEDLNRIAGALGISDHVLFTGMVPNPYDYMVHADIFVLPSDVEGMPNALLEAMQCGLPVISTDCGAEEVLDPEGQGDLPWPEEAAGDAAGSTSAAQEERRIRRLPYGLLVPVCGSNMVPEDFSHVREISPEEKVLSRAMRLLSTDKKLRDYYVTQAPSCTALFSMEHIIKKWLEVF